MAKVLSDTQIASRLKKLKGWKREGDFLVRTLEFGHFMDVIAFINEIAEVAERQEHHPDINIRYTTVKLSVQTHDEGGITEMDFELARGIDVVYEAVAREQSS